mmetsp:Transcript_6702/g.15451  ORF Transcript_6702/g.15451 Transcript_6702/m.15451 type:complete len:132 (+) Transcript_6702:43-438(+)
MNVSSRKAIKEDIGWSTQPRFPLAPFAVAGLQSGHSADRPPAEWYGCEHVEHVALISLPEAVRLTPEAVRLIPEAVRLTPEEVRLTPPAVVPADFVKEFSCLCLRDLCQARCTHRAALFSRCCGAGLLHLK